MRLGRCGHHRALSICLLSLLPVGGCVERKLTVRSEPEGALVYANDQEIGRTPLTHDFLWYGNYDVQLRHEGYQTLKTNERMFAPWWQWVPFDLLAELTPWTWTDQREFHYKLTPESDEPVAADVMLKRGEQLRGELQSSEFTRKPTTRPTTTTTVPTTTTAPSTAP